MNDKAIVIHTANPDWYLRVVEAAKSNASIQLVNDGELAIKNNSSFLDLMKQAKEVDWRKILALFGITGIGAAIILSAVIDPEPTSKLTLLVAAGAIIAISGAGGMIYLLLGATPMKITAKGGFPPTFEISFG